MRIYMCCPYCEGTNWEWDRAGAQLTCTSCGADVFVDEMGIITSDGDTLEGLL